MIYIESSLRTKKQNNRETQRDKGEGERKTQRMIKI